MERGKQEMERSKQEMERSKQENDLLWKELREELIKDGYVKENKKNFEITIMYNKIITVNGKALSAADQARYLKKFPQLQP